SKSGKINAICFAAAIAQGADVTGYQKFEVSKQSASSFTLNDTPNSVLCHVQTGGHGVASQNTVHNVLVAGLNWDVVNGDTIYVHEAVTGTAPTGGIISVDIFVQE